MVLQIIVAPHAGFCFGVKRAIDQGEELIKKEGGPLATWGPLIHNPQEVNRLREKGIIPREDFAEIKKKNF